MASNSPALAILNLSEASGSTVSRHSSDLLPNLLAMRRQRQNGQEGSSRHRGLAQAGEPYRERAERQSEQPAQGDVAQQGDDREENRGEAQHDEGVVGEQRPERRGDPLAAVEAQLHRPVVA